MKLSGMDSRAEKKQRCVIVAGADIGSYERIRSYLDPDDFVIYCDSGLKHLEGLGASPSLIVGDWDSHDNPHLDTETITLPVAKDDTDSVYAMREGIRRGFKEFLLVGAIGARLDHTLVNTYILSSLENRGCHGMIVDDYSEMELIASHGSEAGTAEIPDVYPFFSLVAIEGGADGVTITDAKFNTENASITADYQYATSNEPLPGRTASVSVKEGRLLLIKITE